MSTGKLDRCNVGVPSLLLSIDGLTEDLAAKIEPRRHSPAPHRGPVATPPRQTRAPKVQPGKARNSRTAALDAGRPLVSQFYRPPTSAPRDLFPPASPPNGAGSAACRTCDLAQDRLVRLRCVPTPGSCRRTSSCQAEPAAEQFELCLFRHWFSGATSIYFVFSQSAGAPR